MDRLGYLILPIGFTAILAVAGYVANLAFPSFGIAPYGRVLMFLWMVMFTVLLWQRTDEAPQHRRFRYAVLVMFSAAVGIVGFTWAHMVPGKSALLAGVLLTQAVVLLTLNANSHAAASRYESAEPGSISEYLRVYPSYAALLIGGVMAWAAFWNTLPVSNVLAISVLMIAVAALEPFWYTLPERIDTLRGGTKRPTA